MRKRRTPILELIKHEINTDLLKLLDSENRSIKDFKNFSNYSRLSDAEAAEVSEFYEKLRKFRKTVTKCIHCKNYFTGSGGKGFCSNPECQESKSHYSGSKRTSIEKLIKLEINIDFLKLLDAENRDYYQFKKYPDFLEKLNKFRESVTKCRICGDYFEKPSKKCATSYCNSEECQAEKIIKDAKALEIRKQTNLSKFGYEAASSSPEIAKKIGFSNKLVAEQANEVRRQTCKEKYGVENVMHREETTHKRRMQNLEKYGSEYYFSSEIGKQKLKEIFIEKYGSMENRNRIIGEKVKETWNTQVDKELANEKRSKTCEEKYGVNSATRRHYKNKQDLNRDFFLTFIDNGLFNIKECSEYFGMTATAVNKFKNSFGIVAPNRTDVHRTQLDLYFKIQIENKLFNTRRIITPHELDIYIPDYRLGIEYHGLMYHSFGISGYAAFNNTEEDPERHLRKALKCEELGIQLLQIFEGESLDLWLSLIHERLDLNSKIHTLSCRICEVSRTETETFLNDNHILGYSEADICIGLSVTSETTESTTKVEVTETTVNFETLVAVMTFSHINDKNFELKQFSYLKHTNVVDGFEKLFRYFLEKYRPKLVISYANRRFGYENIYYDLGFKLKDITSPEEFYFKSNSLKLESKNKYQKHKLKDILGIYDEELSETMNMFNNGYRKIFDCGCYVFMFETSEAYA